MIVRPIEIQLDRPRQFKLTLGAVSKAEMKLRELTGQRANFRELISQGMSITELQALLWAGLVIGERDKTLSFEQVGDMLGIGDLTMIFKAINEAFLEQFPESKEANGDARPLDQLTGSGSGASGELN